jgi:prolyl oligopeptidase
MFRRSILIAIVTWGGVVSRAAAQQPADPYAWLSTIDGPRAMAWVKAQNDTTLATLRADPRFDSLYQRVLEVITSRDRITWPDQMGAFIYNFWQDAEHPRGIWRRVATSAYVGGAPEWETVLDVDALATAERQPWAFKGADCLPPGYRRCLISLSRGGGDAVEVREFDTRTRRFVADGFRLPEAKTRIAWIDSNAVLVATEFGAGSLTSSGYPRIVKRWRRGTPLSAATTVFAGQPSDVGVGVGAQYVDGHIVPTVSNAMTFFTATVSVLRGDSLLPIAIPHDADMRLIGDRMVVYLRTPWAVAGATWPEGALIGIGFDDFLRGNRSFQAIVTPGDRATIDGIARTRDELLVVLLNNVHSELHAYRFRGGAWSGRGVPMPPLGHVGVAGLDPTSDRYFVSYQSFTQPTTLYGVAGDSAPRQLQRLTPQFDATGVDTRQYEAVSRDGTRVPYFLVAPKDMAFDGSNPTVLSGYGGFQISSLPDYNAVLGTSWLAHGGVYVLANIRGGGEFGPAWHRAAMQEHRQRAYDDFLAVAQDLIDRKVTSPRHLGIIGASNGGLLVGVAFTERPELFGAAVAEVPLLDMRDYVHLQAGASWIAEYGDPDHPADWAWISRYSPYQNVVPGRTYPPVLFTTTTRDDRVGPVHARKMAAEMEAMGDRVLFFENTEGGHGSGDTPGQQALMHTVVWTFLNRMLR